MKTKNFEDFVVAKTEYFVLVLVFVLVLESKANTELEQATLLSNGEYFPYRNSDLSQIFEVIVFTSEN